MGFGEGFFGNGRGFEGCFVKMGGVWEGSEDGRRLLGRFWDLRRGFWEMEKRGGGVL